MPSADRDHEDEPEARPGPFAREIDARTGQLDSRNSDGVGDQTTRRDSSRHPRPDENTDTPGHGRLSMRSWALLGAALVLWLAELTVLSRIWWPERVPILFVAMALGIGLFLGVAVRWMPPTDRPVVESAVDRSFATCIWLCGRALIWLAAFIVPLAAYTIARAVVSLPATVPRRIGLTILVVPLVALLWSMRRSRESRKVNDQSPWVRIWIFAGTVTMFAIVVFAGITWELVDAGWLHLYGPRPVGNPAGHGPEPQNAAELMDFYAYQLIKAIPGSIPETLRWKAPFTYTQSRVGALVLAFTLTIGIPVVKFVAQTLADRHRGRPEASTAAEETT